MRIINWAGMTAFWVCLLVLCTCISVLPEATGITLERAVWGFIGSSIGVFIAADYIFVKKV